MPRGVYPHKSTSAIERFFKNINIKESGGWEWMGAMSGDNGYGVLWDGERKTYVHRYSAHLANIAIPEGFTIDHLCRNRRCVNPDHLEAVSLRENIKRGETGIKTGQCQRAKTHCPKGHPYDFMNTYVWHDERYCRKCSVIHQREYRIRESQKC